MEEQKGNVGQERAGPAAATLYILERLAAGDTVDTILASRPGLSHTDVRRAAAEGLSAIRQPRIESRTERVARLRKDHPRAYEPWTVDEDAKLLRRWDEGTRIVDLAKELQRPPDAIRGRLERWLGPSWRNRGLLPTDEG